MNYLTRNKYWILLLWFATVLIFYKIYNNFVFKNNESIIFIILIVGFPITIELICNVTYCKNKKKYLSNQINNIERDK